MFEKTIKFYSGTLGVENENEGTGLQKGVTATNSWHALQYFGNIEWDVSMLQCFVWWNWQWLGTSDCDHNNRKLLELYKLTFKVEVIQAKPEFDDMRISVIDNIGTVYSIMNQDDNAMKRYNDSIELSKKI